MQEDIYLEFNQHGFFFVDDELKEESGWNTKNMNQSWINKSIYEPPKYQVQLFKKSNTMFKMSSPKIEPINVMQ